MSEIAFGQNMIDEIDHAFERVLFALLHNLEYQRGDDVKALTIADRLVVASVGEKHALEERSIAVVLVRTATERRAASSMQIFDDLNAEFVVVRVRAFVECDAANTRPVEVEVRYVFL